MKSLLQDVRYGIRQIGKGPAFAAVVILSLALGIGANTAIFSILDAVLLRSLPVEDPNQLVQIKQENNGDLTNPIWEQIRDHQHAFSGMLAYSQDRFDLADGGESHFAQGLWVSGEFFKVLGVPAMRGRVFSTQDDQHGGGRSGPVAVISYKFWQRNFLNDPSVIGKTLRLNRHTFEIVGVTPPWFHGLDADKSFDVAIPIGCDPILRPDNSSLNNGSFWWLRILGRIASGKTIQQAGAQVNAIAPEVFRATVPAEWPRDAQQQYLAGSFDLEQVTTGFSDTGTQYRTALYALMAIVGLVLLIACANVANLLLARATARQREFSVRMAVGASRSRVIRQLMTESILLSGLGAGGGFLIASWGSRMLVRMISTTANPLDIDLSPNLHVLAFTIAATVVTAIFFGLAPAFRGTRLDLNQSLKDNSPAALRGWTRFNLGKALVGGQIALSLVLLVGTGLFVTTLRNLLNVDAGFNRQNVLLITANVQQVAIPKDQRTRIYQEILERVKTVPGVVSASSSVITPISGRGWAQASDPEGFHAKSPEDTLIFLNRVSPKYFSTMKTALLAGREFSDHDNMSAPRVMVVDESTAKHFFGLTSPIGKTIGIDEPAGPGEKEIKRIYNIVGVVRNAKYAQINEGLRRTAFLASGQDANPQPDIRYEIRSSGTVETLIPSIRSAISEVNHGVSLEFGSLETQVDESLLQQRLVALLSSIFGSLALLLAVIGLYGITAYGVARRTAEIGIRIALGAQQQAMIRLVLRDVLLMLIMGVSSGLLIALALGRLVMNLLYGVHPNDPIQLVMAGVILAVATAIAAYIPARRAARIDPMVALRYE